MMSKILYVEDNEDTATAVMGILKHAGFDEVEIALTGEEGLEKLRENEYDVVLLDIMLPKMSGWDLFEKIRKEDLTEGSLAFLSAIPASSKRLDKLRDEGLEDYIEKPFEKDDLIQRVKKMAGE